MQTSEKRILTGHKIITVIGCILAVLSALAWVYLGFGAIICSEDPKFPIYILQSLLALIIISGGVAFLFNSRKKRYVPALVSLITIFIFTVILFNFGNVRNIFNEKPVLEVRVINSTGSELGYETGMYKILVISTHGLAYYEEGLRGQPEPKMIFTKKQGQISDNELEVLKKLIEECPFSEDYGYYSARSTLLGETSTNSSVYYPAYEYYPDFSLVPQMGKELNLNYDIFTQDITILSDVPDNVRQISCALQYIVEHEIAVTDNNPRIKPTVFR